MQTRMLWDIPAEAANVSLCRHAVRILLEHNSISETDIDDAELVVGELCSNVVRHAYDARAGRIAVKVELNGLDVCMSVTDTGKGFDSQALPDPPVFTESGGMGFYLMQNFSDNLTIGVEDFGGSAITAMRHVSTRRASPTPMMASGVPSAPK